MKKYTTVFIKEIVPIIIGILIAMYISNWNEYRKDKKYINKIYSSIKKELRATHKEIKYNIPLQKSMIDTLNFYLNDNKMSLLNTTIKAGGFKFPLIKMNSWKAISNSRIELLDYNKISDLANIEEQKDILKVKLDNLSSFLFPNVYETGKEKKQIIKIMMLDIISTEKTIQKKIEQIIETSK